MDPNTAMALKSVLVVGAIVAFCIHQLRSVSGAANRQANQPGEHDGKDKTGETGAIPGWMRRR